MKALFRISLSLVLALLMFLALACGLLFIPGVQVRLANLFLRQRFDYVGLEALKLSPSSLVLHNLQLVKNEAHISLPKLELYWDFFSLLHRKPFHLKSFEMLDLRMDAPRPEALNALFSQEPSPEGFPLDTKVLPSPSAHTQPSPHQEGTPASPGLEKDKVKKFLGLLEQVAFLDQIAIDKLVLRGNLSFTDAELSFFVSAQELAPKSNGRLHLDGQYKNTQQDRPFDSLSLEGDIRVHFENKDQAREIQGDILAKLDHPGEPLHTHFSFGIEPTLNGEHYTLESFILEEANQASALFSLEGAWDKTLQKINATFSCNVDELQFHKLFPHKILPDTLVKLKGTADYTLKQKALGIAAFFDLDAKKLERLEPSLASLEAVYLRSKLDAKLSAEGIELKVLQTLLQDKSGKSLLKCDLLQPFATRFTAKGLQFSAVQGPLLSLNLTDFPFAYLSPFIKNYTVQASPVSASFKVTLDGQTLSFACSAPLSLNKLYVFQEGEPLFEDLSFEIAPHISYKQEAILLEYTQCKLMQGKAKEDLFSLQGKIKLNLREGQAPLSIEAAGMALANIQGLLNQHGIKKYYNPTLPGRLFLASSYNGSYQLDTKILKLNELEVALSTDLSLPKEDAYLSFQALQSTSFDCSLPALAPFSANAQGPLFKLVLNQLPLSLLEPLQLPLSIGGDSVSGSLVLSREDLAFPDKTITPGYSFVFDKSLNLRRLSLKQDKHTVVTNLNGSLAAEGFFSPQYLRAQWTQASLSFFGSQKTLLESNGQIALRPEAGLDGLETVDVKLSLDLPQAFSLESMPFLNNLEKGKLQFTFYGNFGSQKSFKSLLYLKNLVFVNSSQALDSLNLSLVGHIENWKALQVKGPLIVQGLSGKTDLEIDATYSQGPNRSHRYALKLEGDHAFVDDLMLLSQAVLPEKAPEAQVPTPGAALSPTPLPSPIADTFAFWQGLEGTCSLYIGALHYKDIILTQLQLDNTLSPSLALAKLEGKYMGAAFASTLDLTFSPKLPKPYSLKAKLDLAEFDLAPLVVGSKLMPTSPLEGTFKVQGKGSSEGLTKEDLFEELQGTLSLNGRNGSIKTFAATSKTMQAGTKVLTLAGAFLGSQVKELDFISQVLQFFSHIPYDQCTLVVERGLDKTLEISTLSLKGPEVYLSGRGKIEYHPNVPIAEQNMHLYTRLDAKGKGASLLNSLGLLRDKTSSEGYFSGPQFTIGGTPSKPDFSELYHLLINSGTQTQSIPTVQEHPSTAKPTVQDPLQSLLNLFN